MKKYIHITYLIPYYSFTAKIFIKKCIYFIRNSKKLTIFLNFLNVV